MKHHEDQCSIDLFLLTTNQQRKLGTRIIMIIMMSTFDVIMKHPEDHQDQRSIFSICQLATTHFATFTISLN